MSVRIVSDWARILQRAWSVRLMLIGAVLQGAALYWSAFEGTLPPGLFFGLGILLQVAALAARFIDQGLRDDPTESP